MTLGKKMKLIRVENDLSQKKLADKMTVQQSYVSQLELSKSLPTDMYIALFCLTFGITREALLEGVDDFVADSRRNS